MLDDFVELLPRELGAAGMIMAYLFALQALSAFCVAGLWIRVWRVPAVERLALAALATAVLLLISAIRLSTAVILHSGV